MSVLTGRSVITCSRTQPPGRSLVRESENLHFRFGTYASIPVSRSSWTSNSRIGDDIQHHYPYSPPPNSPDSQYRPLDSCLPISERLCRTKTGVRRAQTRIPGTSLVVSAVVRLLLRRRTALGGGGGASWLRLNSKTYIRMFAHGGMDSLIELPSDRRTFMASSHRARPWRVGSCVLLHASNPSIH